MGRADTVMAHPHGAPCQAVKATVNLISGNDRSIALRLHEKPSWVRIAEGVLLHREDLRIEMLLMRASVGAWIEVAHQGHYEIEEVSNATS
jgi:hypothetical protein